LSKVPRNVLHVKIELRVQSRTRLDYTVKHCRRKTVITINDGEIVLVLRPP